MGYVSHHAIVVTATEHDDAATARFKALELGCTVSPVVLSPMNGYASFMVAPDGSKEGWSQSDDGDASRLAFVRWLRGASEYGFCLDWIEVQFGGDGGYDGRTAILSHQHDDIPAVSMAASSPPSGE